MQTQTCDLGKHLPDTHHSHSVTNFWDPDALEGWPGLSTRGQRPATDRWRWSEREITLITYSMAHRYNNDVKHIKILTKEGCYYIAENKKFRSILVSLFLLFTFSFFFLLTLPYCLCNEVSTTGFSLTICTKMALIRDVETDLFFFFFNGRLWIFCKNKKVKGHITSVYVDCKCDRVPLLRKGADRVLQTPLSERRL